LNILCRRFPGGQGGSATVLTLLNSNTTLLEAIALAGGITDGKAHRVKLIRGTAQNPQIYLIDLSSIEGYKQGNIILQANDIIYIDSRDRVAQKILESITPYLTLLSTALLIYGIFK
jgi:polysaccharide biosynthesis/export protein